MINIPQCVRKTDKTISNPIVVITDTGTEGGSCIIPSKTEVEIEGRFYDCSKGIITVSVTKTQTRDERDFLSTLAHEWRHIWQRTNIKGKLNSAKWYYENFERYDYDTAIYKYFTLFNYELDALLFEIKTAGMTWYSDYWINILLSRLPLKQRNQLEYALH